MRHDGGRRRLKVVFITGSGRSGTTVLGNVLGELPGFFHAGEVQRLCGPLLARRIRCGCGVPAGECRFWQDVLAQTFASTAADAVTPDVAGRLRAQVARMRYLPRLLVASPNGESSRAALERYRRISSCLYHAIAMRAGARAVVDSSKSASDAAVIALLPDIEPYFVHVVRDPRAVAYSWHRQRAQAPGKGKAAHWTAGRVARNWALMQCAAGVLRLRHRRCHWITVRYEDLMENPRATLRGMRDVLGESGNGAPFIDDHTVALRPNHTAGGNGNRFRSGAIRLEVDNEWVMSQPRRDRVVATMITFPLLSRFGYPVRPLRDVATKGATG